MQVTLKTAKKILLEPTGLQEENLRQVLNKALGSGIDYADIYLQYSQAESWLLEEGLVKQGVFAINKGFGIRAVSDDKTGFAYADDLTLAAMEEAAFYAKQIANAGQTGSMQVCQASTVPPQLYALDNPLTSLSEAKKIAVLKAVDVAARKCDTRVNQVNVDLTGMYKVILIVASDGSLAADVQPLLRLNVAVLVEENGRKEHGNYGGGGRMTYQLFFQSNLVEEYAREAVRIALVNLEATPAPAGTMPVVLGNGWPAVMLHEAVGHGLEADFNRKRVSVYTEQIGKKVASPLVSVVDQGNIPGARGSLHIDDEGTPSQKTVLIEQGVLSGYMYDKLNARLLNKRSTGNGRRSSYAQIPIPRMTNTFMLAGEHVPQEIIASVEYGIYAVNFSGGQVDITSGEFVFSTSEAYLLQRGKVTRPLKGVTLVGNGPQVLHRITMVGNDLEFDNGVGTCGKNGQNVPVGVGQPTLKISELTVGGSGSNDESNI